MNKPSDQCPFIEAIQVVDFWREAGPDKWFTKDDALDDEFRDRFMDLHMKAARVELDAWMGHPESALALLILLDQFPRNCFRQTGHMYATDPLALRYARQGLKAGLMDQVEPEMRPFVLLPFMHSEDLADQELSVQLAQEYAAESVEWSLHHRDAIKRFGRFPHRNRCLGRETSPEEQAYLDADGFAG